MFFPTFRSLSHVALAALMLSSAVAPGAFAGAAADRIAVKRNPPPPPPVPDRLAPNPVVPVVPWRIPDKLANPSRNPCDTDGEIFFDDAVHVTDVGVNIAGCTAVDIDQDGHLDLIAAASGADKIRIKFGKGDGTFYKTHIWNMGDGPTDVDVGDFNADGYLDIITTNVHADQVRIRWGADTGSWSHYSSYSVGDNPWRVATGDLNNDGRDDFVTVDLLSNSLTVRKRKPSGGFYKTTLAAGDANDIKLADIDDDGDLDLVYPSGIHNSTVKYRKNNGSGTFGNPQTIAMGSGHAENFHGIALGDLDNNGRLDLIATRNSHALVRVLQTGPTNFGNPVAAPTGNNPSQIIMADFDQDGNLDFALTHVLNDFVSVYLGDGNGNAVGPWEFVIAGHTYDLAAGDFNEDGYPDLAVTALEGAYLLLTNPPCTPVFETPDELAPLPPVPAERFIRGDTNESGELGLDDGILVLNWIFGGDDAPNCQKTADANNDATVDMGDILRVLNYLFSGGPEPQAPFPSCGFAPSKNGLSCESYDGCPPGFGGPTDLAARS